MDETQLLKELNKLRAIKPRREWVISTKSQILGKKQSVWQFFVPRIDFQMPKLRPALAFASLALAIGVFFAFTNYESVLHLAFHSNKATGAEYYLSLANKKLSQVDKQKNQSELSSNIKEAALNIKKAADALPNHINDPKKAEKIVKQVAAINKKVKEVQKSIDNASIASKATQVLTTKTATIIQNNIRDTQKKLVEAQIEMLKTRSLNENQQKLFNEAQKDYQNGLYEQALEKILQLTNNR